MKEIRSVHMHMCVFMYMGESLCAYVHMSIYMLAHVYMYRCVCKCVSSVYLVPGMSSRIGKDYKPCLLPTMEAIENNNGKETIGYYFILSLWPFDIVVSYAIIRDDGRRRRGGGEELEIKPAIGTNTSLWRQ